jgi:hypothetical protein
MPLTSQVGGNGAAGPEGVDEAGRVLRIGPGGHLDDDRAGGTVDVDQLAAARLGGGTGVKPQSPGRFVPPPGPARVPWGHFGGKIAVR